MKTITETSIENVKKDIIEKGKKKLYLVLKKKKSFGEEIVEELEYGTTFSLSISEKEPCYPKDETCPKEEAPRYEYYGVFVKN